jgi:hypothetical protein
MSGALPAEMSDPFLAWARTRKLDRRSDEGDDPFDPQNNGKIMKCLASSQRPRLEWR